MSSRPRFCLFVTLGGAVLWSFQGFVMPEPWQIATLACAAVFLSSGYLFMVATLRAGDLSATAPFRYFDPGVMATIGRNAAVAELPGGLRFTGRIGWLMWLFLHLMYLVGFRNRLSVFLNWMWSYFTWDRSARLILEPEDRTPPRPAGPPV